MMPMHIKVFNSLQPGDLILIYSYNNPAIVIENDILGFDGVLRHLCLVNKTYIHVAHAHALTLLQKANDGLCKHCITRMVCNRFTHVEKCYQDYHYIYHRETRKVYEPIK